MKQKKHFFSIIIPTHNRPDKLADCLESLSLLDYSRDQFEVIVIDDGSNTSLQSVVAPFVNQLDLTLLKQTNAGPAAARNAGAEKAKGKFLAFTDDDCAPAPDWLQKLADRFAEVPDHAIGGRTLNVLPKNLYSAASQIIVHVVYAYYNVNPNKACFFASNNMTMPADHFNAIGGFDATYTTSEDRDICDRWRYHGFQMTYATEVLVYHSHVLNFRTFCRQHFNYGRGAYRYHRARVQRGTGRFRPDLKFYMRLFCYPFLMGQWQQASWMIALLVMSQVANAFGFLLEGLKQIRRRQTDRFDL